MYKLMYWNIKKEKLVVFMFSHFDDLMEYINSNKEDFDVVGHFIKIVKESNSK